MNYQRKFKVISTKGLTKDLADKFTIFNGVKCFSVVMFQIYLVFILATKIIKFFASSTQVKSSVFV